MMKLDDVQKIADSVDQLSKRFDAIERIENLKRRIRDNFEAHKRAALARNKKEAGVYWKIVQKLKAEIEQLTNKRFFLE